MFDKHLVRYIEWLIYKENGKKNYRQSQSTFFYTVKMVHREKLIKAFYVISEMINIKNFLKTYFQQKK